MRNCRNKFLRFTIAIAIVIVAFNFTSYAQQFSVSLSGIPSKMEVPTDDFDINYQVSNVPTTLAKVVFYKNDVPYQTITGTNPTGHITENLGQDTYTYRIRAYDANGTWVESIDYKLSVEVPPKRVFVMGNVVDYDNTDPSDDVQTYGPDRNEDHTAGIQAAIYYLSNTHGGGTLYFPCEGDSDNNDPQSIYNISGTIYIPDNITLQGESGEEGVTLSKCRFYFYNDADPIGCELDNDDSPLKNQTMFNILGNKNRIRIRDMWMISRIVGRDCDQIGNSTQIFDHNTTAILLKNNNNESIKDIIFENVSMTAFKYGIKAEGHSISDIKMRGVRPFANHRQLVINATHAYDWDVQNFNLSGMLSMSDGVGPTDPVNPDARQAVVEIDTTGAPSGYTGENKKIKFLQLNCNGSGDPDFVDRPEFCVSIKKHRGLYFKQLHAEGTQKSLVVEDISGTNDEPIILEHSAAVGEFKDDSMKLYLIGNGIFAAPDLPAAQQQNHPDKARIEFIGNGLNSTVVDCGDLHVDRTDTHAGVYPDEYEDPIDYGDAVEWGDWRMQFTHSVRNRESFFAKDSYGKYFPKKHTVCPSGVSGLLNIEEVGGEHFNTGVLPMEDHLPYTNPFSSADCTSPADCTVKLQNKLNDTSNNGTVQIIGKVTVDNTITIPSGKQIVGTKKLISLNPMITEEAELRLELTSSPLGSLDLLQINTPPAAVRVSGITIRNLKLSTNDTNTNGIAIVGVNSTTDVGVSSDMHFSGLNLQGFGKGLNVRRFASNTTNQMVDGVSWKNINFVNNEIAAKVVPSNVSNWNIINLSMESNMPAAVGWHHVNTGSSMQNVSCKGTGGNSMEDCIRLELASIYLTGLKETENVVNDLIFSSNATLFTHQHETQVFYNSVFRNNDFRGKGDGTVKFTGKANITSMNNRYQNFNVSANPGEFGKYTRVTYCGDTFIGDPFGDPTLNGLSLDFDNLYVGVPTATRIKCSNHTTEPRPKPWEDVINWGHEVDPPSGYKPDQPLVGNILDNNLDDLVIYREGAQSEFRIRSIDGKSDTTIQWGIAGDVPLIGKFFSAGSRDQVVVVREVSNGTSQWWVYNPNTGGYSLYYWGIEGDIPFVGNFIDETGDLDEIAIYRPSSKEFWILNPRNTSNTVNFTRASDYGEKIQVGDFLGLGFEQIAQYVNGTWHIINPVSPYYSYTASLGGTFDLPVAGNYLSGNCTQLGVWSEATEQFTIKDPEAVPVGSAPSVPTCGNRPAQSIYWGSNNNSPTPTFVCPVGDCLDCPNGDCLNDIPLKIGTPNSTLQRPTAYRPTNGVYPFSKAKGQWWIHDLFDPNM